MENINHFDHLACLCQSCMASGRIRSISAESRCGYSVLKAGGNAYNKPWDCPQLHNVPSDKETQLSGLSHGSRIWSLALPRAQDRPGHSWRSHRARWLQHSCPSSNFNRVLQRFPSSALSLLLIVLILTSLLKPTEVHSYEVYHSFLEASHFLSLLFRFAS